MPHDYSKHWDFGVTGAVVRDGKVLYVQRNYEPSKGLLEYDIPPSTSATWKAFMI